MVSISRVFKGYRIGCIGCMYEHGMRDDVVMDARTLHVGGEWYSIEWYAYLWDLRAVELAALVVCMSML